MTYEGPNLDSSIAIWIDDEQLYGNKSKDKCDGMLKSIWDPRNDGDEVDDGDDNGEDNGDDKGDDIGDDNGDDDVDEQYVRP